MTRAQAILLALLAAGLGACGDAGPSVEIAGQRSASRPSGNVLPNATPRQRFTNEAPPEVEPSSDNLIAYDLPEGWRAVAPTRDRLVNLRPAGDPEAECYLSFLAGEGGGLLQNVNRWRAQFASPPLDAGALAALPKLLLLGREATLVEVEGTFTGMGASAARAGFKLLGLVVSEPSGSLFLKFTGPAPLVEKERERFLAFVASVRLDEGHGTGHTGDGVEHSEGDGHDHGTEVPADEPSPSGLTWMAPAGWRRTAPRPAREVTFAIGEGGECYVTRLIGTAGGLRGNLDRWCGQVGRDALSDAAFEALPRIDVLGQPVPVLELEGTFTGMDGASRPGQGLLGVAVIREEDSLFVKFTGPEELVRAERASFLAFAASLGGTVKSLLGRLFAFLGSYGLACLLLLDLFLLTLFGTLHQVEAGLFEAQKRYFESWFVVQRSPVPLVLPGGLLCMGLLAVNLLVGGFVRIQKSKRTAGILVVHAGIALLLASGFVKLYHSNDGYLRLVEGQASDEYLSHFLWEVAVWDASQRGPVVEHLIPHEHLTDLVDGNRRTFWKAGLPFELELSGFLRNCEPLPKGPMWEADSVVVDGFALKRLPDELDAERNLAGLSARFRALQGGASKEDLLWGVEHHPATFDAGGKTWAISLRHARYPMPFTIRLEDFRKEDHPGLTLARSFESDVLKIVGGSEQPVRIQMNEPLRSGGLVLFQSSYGPQGMERGPEYSVFSVVRNPSDHWPLYACIIIGVGLLLAFVPKLVRYIRAQAPRRAAPGVSS